VDIDTTKVKQGAQPLRSNEPIGVDAEIDHMLGSDEFCDSATAHRKLMEKREVLSRYKRAGDMQVRDYLDKMSDKLGRLITLPDLGEVGQRIAVHLEALRLEVNETGSIDALKTLSDEIREAIARDGSHDE